MSDKAYKKIYVNGDCIVDFTRQTVSADTVTSGNLFFDAKGNLVEGKNDDIELIKGMMGVYGWEPGCVKKGLNLPSITKYGLFSSLSSNLYSSNFPFVQYIKLGKVNSISSYEYDYGCYGESQRSFYLSTVDLDMSAKTSFYTTLVNYTYSSDFVGQIYCQDDLSQLELPNYDTDLIISNCSEIKTTEDGLFDYIISNNKVYILALDAEKSQSNSSFLYDDIFEYIEGESSNEPVVISGKSIKFPDTIENLPVVSLGTGIFGYGMNCWYSFVGDTSTSSLLRVTLPSKLEVIGANCFSSFYRDLYNFSQAPNIKFPNTLRSIQSYNDIYGNSYATFCGDEKLFGIESIPLPDSLVKCHAAVLRGMARCFNSQEALSSMEYIPTESNNIAYYIRSANTEITNLVIPEGCLSVIQTPSNITSIQLPSTISSLPSSCLSYKSSLTSITFAETIVTTEIPSSFCIYSSNSGFTNIVIPEGIETINRDAFEYCAALQNITLPSTIKFIGDYAFSEGYNASNLKKVIKIKAQTPPRLYSTRSIVYSTNNLSKIIVPQGCLDVYKNASNWSSFASKMEESTEW